MNESFTHMLCAKTLIHSGTTLLCVALTHNKVDKAKTEKIDNTVFKTCVLYYISIIIYFFTVIQKRYCVQQHCDIVLFYFFIFLFQQLKCLTCETTS